jgi:hypothetical protein
MRANAFPEDDLVDGADRISDPQGQGPSIWFHHVVDTKIVKNRLHLDIHATGRTRSRPAGNASMPRPTAWQAGRHHHWRAARGRSGALRSAMRNPEGNEFDIN